MKASLAFCLIILTLLPSLLIADNLTTTWGKIYYDVEYVPSRSDLKSAYIRHTSGSIKLSYGEMTDSDKFKYGYSPAKIKANAEAIALEQQKRQELLDADAKIKKGIQDLKDLETIIKRNEEDRPKRQAEEARRIAEEARQAKAERERQELALIIKHEKENSVYIINGVAYDCYPYFQAKRNSKLNNPNEQVKTQLLDVSSYGISDFRGKVIQVTANGLLVHDQFDSTILLKGYDAQNSVVDGQYIDVLARYSGRFQYTSVLGAITTVAAYDCLNKPKWNIPQSEIHKLMPY